MNFDSCNSREATIKKNFFLAVRAGNICVGTQFGEQKRVKK